MNFLQHCWSRRWIRGLVWTLVTFVTLVALLLSWTNRTGARDWNATQAALKAEGETLDFRATMYDPIPEAENYCAIPLLEDLALAVDNDINKGEPAEKRHRLETLKIPPQGKGGPRPKLGNLALGKRTDLKQWADWLRQEGSAPAPAASGDAAHDVLAALSKHDAIFQEFTAGLNRPKAQWTPEWKTRALPPLLPSIPLPQYANFAGTNQTLMLRAVAAARAGDTAQAHESAQIIARLNEASLNDPFLIGLLVGVSGTNVLCNVTWELCADHAGTADDFARLESTLASFDLHRAALHAFRGEMASTVDTIQYLKSGGDEARGLLMAIDDQGKATAPARLMPRAIPSGFFDANSAMLADCEFQYVIKPLRDQGLLAAHQAAPAWEKELGKMKENRWVHPSYLITSIMVPVITRVIDRVLYIQVLLDQAIIGCALERYRLEHGSYPDALDAVRLADGKPLPLDVMVAQPMHYRKTTDGRYTLWSVGFDGKDHGGQRVLDAAHPESTKFSNTKYVGDWVWDFPAND